MVDEEGNRVFGETATGAPIPRFTERLKLDEAGQPIPVIVRRYAEKTTLRLAESLGVLVPHEAAFETASAPHMMLMDPDGKPWSIAEVIKARFQARNLRPVAPG
ncbi:MAG: hypothetical protein ABGY29_03615 [bacterium]